MKLGFELEVFLRNRKTGDIVLVPPTLPMDECGWLLEIRSEPHSSPRMAVALLKAEIQKQYDAAMALGLEPIRVSLLEVPRELKVKAARTHGKGQINYRNVYGFETHKNSTKLATASLHVSFTNLQTHSFAAAPGARQETHSYQGFIDHAKYIVTLDKEFQEEIKASKRNPGFYEVKADGRIEYRSLPNTVELNKLQISLQRLLQVD